MKFETLKEFFTDYITLKINVMDKEIDDDFIEISSIEGTNVSFIIYGEEKKTYFGKMSLKDSHILENFRDTSARYVAKIVAKDKNEISVLFIKVNKEVYNDDVSVGICNLDMSLELFKQNFGNDYLINIGKDKYYIYAQHLYGNDDLFSIVSDFKKYDVKLIKRSMACGCTENANDDVWAINKKAENYKKNDYKYSLRKLNLIFDDLITTKEATEANKLEMISKVDYGIISQWEKFAHEDFEIASKSRQEIGPITYKDYDREVNELRFVIDDNSKAGLEKLEALFISNDSVELEVMKAGADKSFCRFNMTGIDKAHNEIIGFYDGDKIFPNSATIYLSNAGDSVVYERRIRAIDRIEKGLAGKKNLVNLISGKEITNASPLNNKSVDAFMDEIIAAFKGKTPNQNQLKAIEIAINTPDFAIIQGPPGCGKTSVIDAIDRCLAKLDSSEHKYASSISTAYQKEATKNMISKRIVNGLPVPFISNSKDRMYIEETFEDYIYDVREKLKQKHSDICQEIGIKNGISYMADFESRVNYDSDSIDKIMDLLMNIVVQLRDMLTVEESQKLDDLLEEGNSLVKKILENKKSIKLYYARLIPDCKEMMEDDGVKTFFYAEALLLGISDKLDAALKTLEGEIINESPNYKLIAQYKKQIIYYLKNEKKQSINLDFNKKISDFFENVRERLEIERNNSIDDTMIEYVDAFLNNPVKVRYALQQWVTSLGATHQISGDSHALFGMPIDTFSECDNVLIDEAARSCPPDLLIPISIARKKIIMVGDQNQLPQFINDEVLEKLDFSDDIKKTMKNVSLFEHMIDATNKLYQNDRCRRFIALNEQYRMPEVLGSFIGETYYKNLGLKSPRGNPCDDKNFVQTMPRIANKCMVWYDIPSAREKNTGSGFKNEKEAVAIAKLLNEFLLDNDNKDLTIGVISFYRQQVNLIKNKLSRYDITNPDNNQINKNYVRRLKIDTVDAFQGLEEDIIILSMVRSNPLGKFSKSAFGFLKDKRRGCVALSRAKRCVVVVGNGEGMLQTDVAMKSVEGLAKFYQKCKDGGEYVDLIK